MSELVPRLRMFAGPNGSGKTTIARSLGREFSPQGLFSLYCFVNADDIRTQLASGAGVDLAAYGLVLPIDRSALVSQCATRLRRDHPFLRELRLNGSHLSAPPDSCDAYAAAAVADYLREELLSARRSFSFETVMSHPSKVDFFARARQQGYRTYLYFIATGSPQLNVHRVQTRTALGGHAVPEDKIVERYHRVLGLLPDALAAAHRAFLFDNSGGEPALVAELAPSGQMDLAIPPDDLPSWFQRYVLPAYPPSDSPTD